MYCEPRAIHPKPKRLVRACSGWAHAVENLEDTLSVNHNYINGFNIGSVWDHMQLGRVEAEAAVIAEGGNQVCRCGGMAAYLRSSSPKTIEFRALYKIVRKLSL